MSKIFEVEKKPDEKFAIGLKYTAPDLAEGESLVSAVVTITPSGEVDNLAKVGSVVVATDNISQMVEKGADGNEYTVIFKTTTSIGHVYEDAILVAVRAI